MYHICWFSFDFIFLQEGQGFFFAFFEHLKAFDHTLAYFPAVLTAEGTESFLSGVE